MKNPLNLKQWLMVVYTFISLMLVLNSLGFFGVSLPDMEKNSKAFFLSLNSSDLPEGFFATEYTFISPLETHSQFIELGWRVGYFVIYSNGLKNENEITIVQYVHMFPAENASKALANLTVSGNWSIKELPDPKIGDKSQASHFIDETGLEFEVLEFAKLDIYEVLFYYGPSSNYGLLKELAIKAAEKIQ